MDFDATNILSFSFDDEVPTRSDGLDEDPDGEDAEEEEDDPFANTDDPWEYDDKDDF